MKALSLWEPWATAMAFRLKLNETRSWWTSYRGDLAICAAKRKMTADELWIYDEIVKPHLPEGYEIPYGKVVCVVKLIDCIPTDQLRDLSELEQSLGNYSPGRFAWKTQDCRPLRVPWAIIGKQGLWNVPWAYEAIIWGLSDPR